MDLDVNVQTRQANARCDAKVEGSGPRPSGEIFVGQPSRRKFGRSLPSPWVAHLWMIAVMDRRRIALNAEKTVDESSSEALFLFSFRITVSEVLGSLSLISCST